MNMLKGVKKMIHLDYKVVEGGDTLPDLIVGVVDVCIGSVGSE